MISRTAEYALRAVVYLGNQHGVPRTTTNISQSIDAPSSYLAKVLQTLRRAQIVHSQRGLHGGFTLAQDLNELTILDVIQAVDALRRYPNCPLGRIAHASGLCPLHQRLDRLTAAVETEFHETTISELLDGPNSNNLCHFPCISDSNNPSNTSPPAPEIDSN